MKHESRTKNNVADALSWRTHLTTLPIEVTGFDSLKVDYTRDKNFGKVYANLTCGLVREHFDNSIHEDYLLRWTWLCILDSSYREFFIWEFHSDGLGRHFG